MCVLSLYALSNFGVRIYDDVVRGGNEVLMRDCDNLCFNIVALDFLCIAVLICPIYVCA